MKIQPQTTGKDRIIITKAERRALRWALTDVIDDPASQTPTWQTALRRPLTELRELLKEDEDSGAGADARGVAPEQDVWSTSRSRAEPWVVGVARCPHCTQHMTCTECGGEMWISDAGTRHHWGDSIDDIDYDLDAEHTAVSQEDPS